MRDDTIRAGIGCLAVALLVGLGCDVVASHRRYLEQRRELQRIQREIDQASADLAAPIKRQPPVDMAIKVCLEKEGTPVYGVGPAGPPMRGTSLQSESFVVVCVEEK